MKCTTEPIAVVLVALYRYQNYLIRILHSLLEKIGEVEPHTIFFENHHANAIKIPTPKEETLFNNAHSSRLKLAYLNFKAVFWGKIHAAKRRMQKRS